MTGKRKLQERGEVVPVHVRKTYSGAEIQLHSLLYWHETKVELQVKRPARQADHSPYIASGLGIKRSYTSTPTCASLGAKGQLYLWGLRSTEIMRGVTGVVVSSTGVECRGIGHQSPSDRRHIPEEQRPRLKLCLKKPPQIYTCLYVVHVARSLCHIHSRLNTRLHQGSQFPITQHYGAFTSTFAL